MNSTLTSHQLDRMAWTISSHGFDTIPTAALRELGFEARRAGVSAAVTNIVADGSAPLVVRQRAFGQIASKLAGALRGSDATTETERPAA